MCAIEITIHTIPGTLGSRIVKLRGIAGLTPIGVICPTVPVCAVIQVDQGLTLG